MPKRNAYVVVCPAGIAKEMFRYDCATEISKTSMGCDPCWTHPDMVEAYTMWAFEFSMVGDPTYGRWASFGVHKHQIVRI